MTEFIDPYTLFPPAGASFPVVESTAAYDKNTTGSGDDYTLPSGIVSGDRLLFIYTGILNPTTPTGWTLFDNYGGSSGAPRTRLFTRDADGTEGSTLTLDATLRAVSIAYRISGAASVADWEVTTTTGGPSTSPDPPSESASYGADNTLWIAGGTFRDQGVDVTAFPTNYTNGKKIAGSGGSSASAGAAQRELNAASEDPGTLTIDASKDWGAFTVAVKPA